MISIKVWQLRYSIYTFQIMKLLIWEAIFELRRFGFNNGADVAKMKQWLLFQKKEENEDSYLVIIAF